MTEQKKLMLAAVSSLQTAINNFVTLGDEYLATLKFDDYEVEGPAVRQMQSRVSRLQTDLSDLHRRIDA